MLHEKQYLSELKWHEHDTCKMDISSLTSPGRESSTPLQKGINVSDVHMLQVIDMDTEDKLLPTDIVLKLLFYQPYSFEDISNVVYTSFLYLHKGCTFM